MNIGKVIGRLWASAKHESLKGGKLLIVRLTDINGNPTGGYEVAFDTADAGVNDIVLTVKGSSSKMTASTAAAAIDCTIVGVVDHVER
jgi:ethanolamine utilization protein EutN